MKKLLKITAVLLALTTAVMALPLSAFAAPRKRYVSEVMTYTAKSYDEAKAGLEKLGYTIVGDSEMTADLNSTSEKGVYLGCKTTVNPDEALTDLAVMNMNGDFSEAKYQEMLAENRDAVSAHINEQLPAIASFQNNCKNGSIPAKIAYENLNNYVDDKVGNFGPMGDYLLKFNSSEAAKEMLTDIFMKGDSEIIHNIEKLLVMASEDGKTGFIERMIGTDYDAIEEEYIDEFGSLDLAELEMSRAFDETAGKILSGWESFRAKLRLVEKQYVIYASDGSPEFNEANIQQSVLTDEDKEGLTAEEIEILETVNSELNLTAYRNAFADFVLFRAIYSTDCGDMSLYDWFNRSAADIELWELYPMVNAMNLSQRTHVKSFGIGDVLDIAFSSTSAETPEDITRVYKASEPISVYSGVDLSIFESGVAFTSQAQKYETLNDQSWFDAVMEGTGGQGDYLTAVIVTSSIAAAAFTLGGLSYLFSRDTAKQISTLTRQKEMLFSKSTEKIKQAMKEIDNLQTHRNVLRQRVKNELSELKSSYLPGQLFRGVMFLIFIISFIMDINTIIEYISAKQATESEIPHHLVTAEDTKDGSTYIYYATVKNQKGKAADINDDNDDNSIGWLVLYSTKDKKAGSPIEAGSLNVKHDPNDAPLNSAGVHLFGDAAAANVTSKLFTGRSDASGGTYIFFARDAKAYTASVFTADNLIAAGAGGLVLGLVLGLTPMFIRKGAKRKEDEAEQE